MKPLLLFVSLIFFSSCWYYNPFRKYHINYKKVAKIEFSNRSDSTSAILITNRDSIKQFVKKYLNKNHSEIVLKTRRKYLFKFIFVNNEIKTIYADGNYLTTDKGTFKTRKKLNLYFDNANTTKIPNQD